MTDFSCIPNVAHYAIITHENVHIPGDKANGYDDENRECLCYQAFCTQDREKWEAEITKLTRNNVDFKAIHVDPAKITINVSVDVKVR